MAVEQPASDQIALAPDGYLRTGRSDFDRRVRRSMDAIAEEVAQWSRANKGRLRTRLAIREELAAEFLTLCAALGPWALVRADEIFPGPLSPDLGDLNFDSFD